jgi:RNA polymerase sigma-70 factor (ECF subfamily)
VNKKQIDTVLIKQALRGDQVAYKSLYELYKQRLFVICLRYAKERSKAQDYLQEAFINIFKNLEQFDEKKGFFESWAKRIAINTCLMDIRKQTLYAIGLNGAEHIESKEVGILSELSLKEMLALIQQLPLGYRTIFNMYVIDGYTHKEISQQLDISISTSKSQLMKARHLLQKKITTQQQAFNQEHG